MSAIAYAYYACTHDGTCVRCLRKPPVFHGTFFQAKRKTWEVAVGETTNPIYPLPPE